MKMFGEIVTALLIGALCGLGFPICYRRLRKCEYKVSSLRALQYSPLVGRDLIQRG